MLQFKESELRKWIEICKQNTYSQSQEELIAQMQHTVNHKPQSNCEKEQNCLPKHEQALSNNILTTHHDIQGH